jgi:hypothetical protein
MESNGDFVFYTLKGDTLVYTVVNLTKAVFKNRVLINPKPSFFAWHSMGALRIKRESEKYAIGVTRFF